MSRYTAIVALAVGIGGVAWLQPSLARTIHETKARDDVYAFPAPDELRLMSLGHRAALADLLWVKLRIEYGIHWVDRRPFKDASRYLDAIVELDPEFESPYTYGDTIVIYQFVAGGDDEARWAKSFLERGTKERPHDAKLWAHYGQFLAFMAPTYIKDKPTLAQWRREGAIALARSVELGGDVAHSRTAAGLLSETGERDAAIRALQNAYVVTDDLPEKQHIAELLAAYHAENAQQAAQEDLVYVQQRWVTQYPYLSRGSYVILAPRVDPLACAGRVASVKPECATTWQAVLPSSASGPRD